MNEVASWWVLSLALGCLCALFAYPSHGQSFLGAHRQLRRLPRMLSYFLYLTLVPLSLACFALALTAWLIEQSVQDWLESMVAFAKPIGVILSLQAHCLLLHRKMYGSWVLLLLGALSFQLWLFYQSLGIEFSHLGMFYGAALFILLTAATAIVDRINSNSRLIVARFFAFLLLVLQWLFATGSRTIAEFSGLEGLTASMALLTPALMLTLTIAGFAWQTLVYRTARAGR